MTEEVKETLFSEMGKSNVEWKKPESMLVMKKKGISYASYYNAEKNKWGGLLEATIYTGNEVPNMEDAEVVDYRAITGLV